jgi:hypothetical protein
MVADCPFILQKSLQFVNEINTFCHYSSKSIYMSAAAKSVFYFGLYLYLVGLTLLIAPNFLLSLTQMPATQEVWIRVVGILTIAIAFYYQQAGSKNIVAFFPLTVVVRIFVFLSFIGFVLLNFASPMLIGFGVVDFIGAIWTWQSLKKK